MQYKLTWQDAIKAIFVGGNIFITGIFAILLILPVLISLLYVRELLFFIVILTVIIPLCILSITNLNSGWCIEDEFFQLKAFASTKKMKISSMEIGMVKNNGDWHPSTRILGVGLPGLLMGDCRLKNKETALVFRHLNVEYLLLILMDGKYYLIGHPGIEKLHQALLAMGASIKKFE